MLKANSSKIEARSREVQEVVGRLPDSLIPKTLWTLSLMFLVMVVMAWFMKYPDILSARVVVSTTPPPYLLSPKIDGSLVLVKGNESSIKKGELIGYINSNADPFAVLKLEENLLSGSNIVLEHNVGSLGDLHSKYSELKAAVNDLNLLERYQLPEKQIEQLTKQLNVNSNLIDLTQSQIGLNITELQLVKLKFEADSLLFHQGVIPLLDFNESKINWIQQRRLLMNGKMSRINLENEMILLKKDINEIQINRSQSMQRLKILISNKQDELLSGILQWKENYLITAPSNGKCIYLTPLYTGLVVTKEQSLFGVIADSSTMVAHAELPLRGSGKVRRGQIVNIKLDDYPFEEFGILNGEVIAVSPVPVGDKYLITINLSNGLKTTHGILLPFKNQYNGTSDIITNEVRVLERVLFRFRNFLPASSK